MTISASFQSPPQALRGLRHRVGCTWGTVCNLGSGNLLPDHQFQPGHTHEEKITKRTSRIGPPQKKIYLETGMTGGGGNVFPPYRVGFCSGNENSKITLIPGNRYQTWMDSLEYGGMQKRGIFSLQDVQVLTLAIERANRMTVPRPHKTSFEG